jgi:hypothetical protein
MPAPARRSQLSFRRRNTPARVVVESFERRLLFAIDVTIGTGSPSQTLTFTDGDGTVAQIRASGGTATITFDGNPVSQSTSGRLTTVTGTGVTMTNMVLAGANPNVGVRTTSGNGTATLGGLSSQPPVRAFSGRGVVLTGPAALQNGIGRLELAGVQGTTLTINRSGEALLQDASITLLSVTDTTITSQQPMRQLRVGNWSAGVPGVLDSVTTPRINVLQCGGDFNAGVTLSGNGQVVGRPVLGNAKVLGALASGTWNVAGKTSRVAAGSVGSDWSGRFGDVASFATAGDLSGSLTADSIKSLSAGTLTNAQIDLNRAFAARATALNRLNVRGAITGTRVRSDADIGTVSAASITGSSIFAGVANGGGGGAARSLPIDATAFVNAATIKSVTIRTRGTPSFVGSNIVASTLGRINGGTIDVNNGGTPYGLAAQTIGSLSGQRNDTGESRHVAGLTDPSDTIVVGDFQARVF